MQTHVVKPLLSALSIPDPSFPNLPSSPVPPPTRLNGKPRKLSTKNVTFRCALQSKTLAKSSHPCHASEIIITPKPLCKIVYPKPVTPVSHVIACASSKGSISSRASDEAGIIAEVKEYQSWFIVCCMCGVFVQVMEEMMNLVDRGIGYY